MRFVLLSLILAALTPGADASPASLVLEDVAWRASREGDGVPRLTLSRGGAAGSGLALDERTVGLNALRQVYRQGVDGPVAFTLDRDPGSLGCVGALRARTGSGRCRFASRPDFKQGLAARNMPLGRRTRLFDLLLVSARLERADGLAREGVPLRDANDLVAASALDVHGGYARELKTSGLTFRSFNDLSACRAPGVDGDWVRGLASASYWGLNARRAIALKAVGVTPGYARAMNGTAARTTEGSVR